MANHESNATKNVKKIRVHNVKLLVSKYQNKSEFARLIQVSPEYLYHILAGRRMIADVLARRIEVDLKKSKGWLDIKQ
jgi:plasmid maintenance system antidote protein VapI